MREGRALSPGQRELRRGRRVRHSPFSGLRSDLRLCASEPPQIGGREGPKSVKV